VQNLERMRTFYKTYSISETLSPKSIKSSTLSRKLGKRQTVSAEFILSRSHYVFLMRLEEKERVFYEIESTKNNRSLRELKRQFNSALYERIALSKNTADTISTYHEPQNPIDIIKDPYVLEFLGLKENTTYSESDIEQAIINRIEHFLLELGKGFAFIGRQERFTFDEKHFFVDLVFYNRLLKCFVIIDLKI